jgi:hypothetical protein
VEQHPTIGLRNGVNVCIHPEALSYKNRHFYSPNTNIHTCEYRRTHDLPNKGYWVVRNSSYYRPNAKENLGEAECERFK